MKNIAILLLGGRSTRMQGLVDDKVLTPLAGKPVFMHSMDAFAQSGVVDGFVIVFRDATQREMIEDILKDFYAHKLPVKFVLGGVERRDSVYNALSMLSSITKTVYIHDAARPLIKVAQLRSLQQAVAENKAAALAHPSSDTLVKIPKKTQITAEPVAHKVKPLKRKRIWAMETPQVFDFPLIKSAYEQAFEAGRKITDDVSAASYVGHSVALIENDQPNPKLTTGADFDYLEFLLEKALLGKK